MIHFVCALRCEADPIIRHYGLRHAAEPGLFSIYLDRAGQVSLTLTGIGKLASAAATVYTHCMLGGRQQDVWLNVGIAGHQRHDVGQVYLSKRVQDAASGRSWYPQLVMDSDLPAENLTTLDRPSTDYGNSMIDMEASGFLSAASRFGTMELIHCIKTISDNTATPAAEVNAAMTQALLEAALPALSDFTDGLRLLSAELPPQIDISGDFEAFLGRWHFTRYQQHQLRQLLHRWRLVLPGESPLGQEYRDCRDAVAVMSLLRRRMDGAVFYLDGNSRDV